MKKTILLLLITSFAVVAKANEKVWLMVYQSAEGKVQELLMSDVGSLVAVDDAYDFTILSTTGSVLAEGVLKVSFEYSAATSISPSTKSDDMIARAASDKLTLIGVSGEVCVYDTAGVLKKQVNATGGETIINIAQLPAGVYIVKNGNQTFKFMKNNKQGGYRL